MTKPKRSTRKQAKTTVSPAEAKQQAKELVQKVAEDYDREKVDQTADGNSEEPQKTADPKKTTVKIVTETSEKSGGKTKAKQIAIAPELPPKPKARHKPAWIQYYEQQVKRDKSDFGRGFSQTYDYFENDLMGNYVNSCERFFDTIKQNPEACSIVYPDEHGRMRIIHHLTIGLDSSAIIVGVEGLGNLSKVKAINIESFSDKMEIGAIDGDEIIPTMDALTNPESKDPQGDEKDQQETKLGEFFNKCASGFLIHPIWLFLIYEAVGMTPGEMAGTLLTRLQESFDTGVDYLNEYNSLRDYHYEVYSLLVYLWACQEGKFSIDHRELTTSSNSSEFREIQRNIISKILQPTAEITQVREEVKKRKKPDRKPDSRGTNSRSRGSRFRRSPSSSQSPSPPPRKGRKEKGKGHYREGTDDTGDSEQIYEDDSDWEGSPGTDQDDFSETEEMSPPRKGRTERKGRSKWGCWHINVWQVSFCFFGGLL